MLVLFVLFGCLFVVVAVVVVVVVVHVVVVWVLFFVVWVRLRAHSGGSIVNRGRHDAAPGLVVWLKMYDMRNGESLPPGANWTCQATAPVAAQTALSLPCPVAWPEGVASVPVVC